MKPLNRPMFRYGGPIKEGVMSGIREPKKNGGPAGIGLVGDQRYPKTNGREHHAFFLAGAAVPAGLTALRVGAQRAIPKIANFFRTQVGTKSVPKQGPTLTLPGKTTYSKGYSGTVPGRTITPGTGEVPTYAPNFLGRDPTVRLVGGAYKAVTNPAVTGIAGKTARLVFSPTGLVAGAIYAGGKFFDSDGNEIKNAEEKGLVAGDRVGTSGAPGGGDPGMYLEPQAKGGEGATLSKEELRKKNVERYRDIMDIKGMNKDAAYDSLIAASQAVNQAGGDLKGSIRDGSLINQIIQSTSKAFDKPAKTKDAIDTLILKGEIEKDIKASDPSNEILNRLREVQIKKGLKDIEGGDYAENIAIATKAGSSGQTLFDQAASLTVDDFRGNLITKTDIDKVIKDKKKEGILDERDIIVSYTNTIIEGKEVPDGNYTVGKNLITIKDNKVFDIK